MIGIGSVVVGSINSNWQIIMAGALAALGFGTVGTVSMHNENTKANSRKDEREKIYQELRNLN